MAMFSAHDAKAIKYTGSSTRDTGASVAAIPSVTLREDGSTNSTYHTDSGFGSSSSLSFRYLHEGYRNRSMSVIRQY